jgi:hypothetical protein
MNSKSKIRNLLGLTAALLGLCAAPAHAAPEFGLSLRNDGDERQRININATGGNFTIGFDGEFAEVAHDASPGTIEEALNELSTIGGVGGSVAVQRSGSGTTIRVEFDGGALAHTDVPEMTVGDGTPSLEGNVVIVTEDDGGVARGDERVDYEVQVGNVAPVVPPTEGSRLFCDGVPQGPFHLWINAVSWEFQWVRDGVPLTSGEDIAHGSQTDTYEVQAADEGSTLQCLVTGSNEAGSGAFTVASQFPTVIEPVPERSGRQIDLHRPHRRLERLRRGFADHVDVRLAARWRDGSGRGDRGDGPRNRKRIRTDRWRRGSAGGARGLPVSRHRDQRSGWRGRGRVEPRQLQHAGA